jgi:hypothetical protein
MDFAAKYNDIDRKIRYKKRVKKIDNINSKFKKLNMAVKIDFEKPALMTN